MAREQSSIGSSIYYGPRSTDNLGSAVGGVSGANRLVHKFSYDNIPAVDANDSAVVEIPAGSIIKSCYVEVTTAITGATDWSLGGAESDGSNADVDGFVTTAVAAIGAGTYVGDGAYVGASLDNDTQLTLTFTGTATAGELAVYIEYI